MHHVSSLHLCGLIDGGTQAYALVYWRVSMCGCKLVTSSCIILPLFLVMCTQRPNTDQVYVFALLHVHVHALLHACLLCCMRVACVHASGCLVTSSCIILTLSCAVVFSCSLRVAALDASCSSVLVYVSCVCDYEYIHTYVYIHLYV
jgi:hypothetical protein